MHAAALRAAAFAAAVGCAVPALAHDPSAWGGLFRSRDNGAAWLAVDAGVFVGTALAVAVSPTDASHLLYATEARLLRSRNGGRDWAAEAPQLFDGPTLAVAFAGDGRGAWAATPAGLFATTDGSSWRKADVADAALPGRVLAAGAAPGRVYLLGARGVYASADHGQRFVRIGLDDLPDAGGRSLVVMPTEPEAVLALLDGRVWASGNGGQSWTPRDGGLPAGQIEALAGDRERSGRAWAASGESMHVSDDSGRTWRPWGRPFSDTPLTVNGIAAAMDGATVVLATRKGLLRSTDRGGSWSLVEGAVPQLEAGPLLRDPQDARTMYAGFSLLPYSELRHRAERGTNLLLRLDPISVAGAVAFLLLLLIGGVSGARWLARTHHDD